MTKDEILTKIYEYLLVEVEDNKGTKTNPNHPLNSALKKVGDLLCMEDEMIEKRLKYEPRTNAAYVYFKDGKTKVVKSPVFKGKSKDKQGEHQMIILDQDKNGELVGLEVLFVKEQKG
jgi:uncharacterized protein YuzE